MIRTFALAAALCLLAAGAPAQTAAPAAPKSKKAAVKPKPKTNPGAGAAASPATSAKTADTGTAAAPADATTAPAASTTLQQASPAAAEAPKAPALDTEEFRRQVMEEVRKELQKTKDDVKKETQWVEQDSQARVQDSEAVEKLKQQVNLFQPHGYVRLRGEFFNNLRLGRGTDPSGYYLFPGPFIGETSQNNSQSDANFRFRFEPTLEVSEDLSIHSQFDILDNVLLGSSPAGDPFLDPFTPLAVLSQSRGGSAVNVKRVWGRVNTQLGEFLFGRMGYHWGLGILHNDGNCLDCDYGDTYDRVAFAPREFKGHHLSLMMDLLDKGAGTTGEHGELGRNVDLDTLDDGYRVGLEITRLDNPEEVKRKLDADRWVVNYGLLLDYRTQGWDTPVSAPAAPGAGITPAVNLRADVVRRAAKIYQPDVFVSLKRRKWRLDAEFAMTIGSVGTRQTRDEEVLVGLTPSNSTAVAALEQPIDFLQWGGAMQTDLALLPADALLIGLEYGAASGDKGAYGFGARPWRSGSGNVQPAVTAAGEVPFRAAGPGDIDGSHLDFSEAGAHHKVNNFVFNRAFNVDMILWRNLVTSVASGWYLKPSVRYRPTGRKSGGGDDTGFELYAAAIYSQAWFETNTPGGEKPLGLEGNVGITYDTSDRFHFGVAYGLLLPFGGLRNPTTGQSASVAHAARFMMAIPF